MVPSIAELSSLMRSLLVVLGLGFCSSFPLLGAGCSLGDSGASGEQDIVGGRPFSHDTPNSPPRNAFVIKGQTVQEMGVNNGGFVSVRFTSPTGRWKLRSRRSSPIKQLPQHVIHGLAIRLRSRVILRRRRRRRRRLGG